LQQQKLAYLLIQDNKRLVGATTKLLFQVDENLNALLNELPFGFDEFLPLIGRLVEESRVDFTLIFKKT